MIMGLIGWVVIGLLIGFVVSKTLDLRGDDPRLGIAIATAGAIVAATLYTVISGAGVSALNLWSMFWAAIGAGSALAVWHGVRSRYVSHAPFTRRSSY